MVIFTLKWEIFTKSSVSRMETNLNRTYDSLEEDAVSLMDEHYGEGIDGYSLWAEIPTCLKAWRDGIENAPDHPAQLHYAWLNNADGTPNNLGLDDGIRLATTKAIKLLKLDYEKLVTLLDIGCGVGGAALQADLFLQQQGVKDFEIHGISIVPKQVQVAKNRSHNFGASNSSFIVGNFLNLPYESDHFKGITAFETLCHIPPANKLNLLRGLLRVTAPGGRMVIMDAYFTRRPGSVEEKFWFNKFRNGWTLPDMVTSEEMHHLALKSGFEIETTLAVINEVRPSVDLIYRRAKIIGVPLLRIYRLLKKLGHESQLLQRTGIHSANAEAFIHACYAQKELVERGLMTYQVHVLRKPHV
jgi:ubiquinone/menaquinone biosynthesis C-methylase UbiE